MNTRKNIFAILGIASIILGTIIVFLSFIPCILQLYWKVTFSFDVANFFLFGFLIGACLMALSIILFDLDK